MPTIDALSGNLLLAVAGVAVTHTLLGPDHYLPFIMLARARHWSHLRTALVTGFCGFGHVLSSLLLGTLGLAAGNAISKIEKIEGMRGDWAAWALFGFGIAYLAWGVRKAIRKRSGIEPHTHGPGLHIHAHGDREHVHAAALKDKSGRSVMTFWSLFIIFVLGPCEPLIPLFMLPASRGRWDIAMLAGGVFGVLTIACMVGVTMLALTGLRQLNFGPMERWSHAMAGAVIALSGAAVLFLGL